MEPELLTEEDLRKAVEEIMNSDDVQWYEEVCKLRAVSAYLNCDLREVEQMDEDEFGVVYAEAARLSVVRQQIEAIATAITQDRYLASIRKHEIASTVAPPQGFPAVVKSSVH